MRSASSTARWLCITAALVGLVLAGCASPRTSDHELRGTFTENASDEQMSELEAEVTDRGGQVAFLESFPVQFHATGLEEAGCEEVRSFAQEADYVREVGNCQVDEDEAEGDETTSKEG